jgi:hypothetical protein
MRDQIRLRTLLIAVAIFVTACWCLPGGCSDNAPAPLPPTPEATPTYTEAPAPTSTFTPTPEEEGRDRCWIFEQITMQIIMLDLLPSDTMMTMYVRMPGGVPGLEIPVPGDDNPWQYYVELGDMQSEACSFEGYEERLYCFIPIPPEYHDTAQPFNLFVNLCEPPLLSHPHFSVITTSFDDIPIDTCGPAPGNECGTAYEDWCNCKGGTYECVYFGGIAITYRPVCILP